jgi:hypothetical protein
MATSRATFSLWMGHDHVLLVERNGYTENYRRFYFSDIQVVMIRRTASSGIIGGVTGVLAGLFLFFGWAVNDLAGRIILWIIAGCFALICLINFARGPSCRTSIQTAVQTVEIPSWGRIRTARKGMSRLRPRLQEAQGVIPPEDLRTQWVAGLGDQPQNPAAEMT